MENKGEAERARLAPLRVVKPGTNGLQRTPPRVPTVLIVDDEDAIRDFLRSALEAEGYSVLAAGDGEAALTLCERYRPDVILLDLMMPRLDGLGFLHRFRRRFGQHAQDGPVIYIMSAVPAAVERVEPASTAGAFLKPFDLDELLETIDACLRRPGRLHGGAAGEGSAAAYHRA